MSRAWWALGAVLGIIAYAALAPWLVDTVLVPVWDGVATVVTPVGGVGDDGPGSCDDVCRGA